ncbi:MAG: hypothetical protein HFG89_00265 [Dorea sp.]|nr:hypothetical protein [Dorea sp.]
MKINKEMIIEESKEIIDTYFEGELAKEDKGYNDQGIELFPFQELIEEAIQNERKQYSEQ